jgi:hypothetical protein
MQHETPVARTTDIILEDKDQKRRRVASDKKNIAFEKRKKISNAAIDKTQVSDPEGKPLFSQILDIGFRCLLEAP